MINYSFYSGEHELLEIKSLVEKDLSEPYSIFVYRFFLVNNPELCIIARHQHRMVGVVIGRAFLHKKGRFRGYIGMLTVAEDYRRKYRIGTKLVQAELKFMRELGVAEVVLEAESTNTVALNFYKSLGFERDKYLYRYYMNGSDAFRLKYFFPDNNKLS